MKPILLSLILFSLMPLSTARAKMPGGQTLTVQVCLNPATDARFDTTKVFFAATAPIFAAGTIAVSATPIDCTSVTAKPIGTFFTNGAIVNGLPASAPDDVALVTWHFRIGDRAFDTIGPVKGVPAGGTYPQTVVGATHGLTPSNQEATVTTLDPTGFVFEITVPGGERE